ncbi:TetR/AcrR family transcriptional regulator [Levilactobacillus suantsaiihabitans]|uniref:TetR/AcrR family transcriptional regulator n=1 Tax=Levilactobacillus suantsaiihabitans TaxID=2487722 RepID=A0A4Z0J9X8_9LACO|nr:TetR/AcrR family transcriptional regulator [Levilactobacillus suantsaiihabitans]TGD19021.1 TetR/AcrR family transcriptional regulator [Levilactobacillus suantsaiihabitans]
MTKLPYHRQNLAVLIQQQARQQLEEQGAANLSLRQIARFLAVTPAAVYRHFPDKASLLAALHEEITAELAAALRANVLDSADATAMLQQMITNLVTFATDHPRAVRFILTTPLAAPQSLTTVLTLVRAQRGLVGTAADATAVWTFLVGVLCQLPDAQLTVDWIAAQVDRLLGEA